MQIGKKRIDASITDTGNALELDEAIASAKNIRVEALREYIIAVGEIRSNLSDYFIECKKAFGGVSF